MFPQKTDLTNCDKEPIHKLNRIQNHGFVLVCEPDTFVILQYSSNIAQFLKVGSGDLPGKDVAEIIGHDLKEALNQCRLAGKWMPLNGTINNNNLLLIPHISEGHLILEFEEASTNSNPFEQQLQLTNIITVLSNAEDEQEMCDMAAELVKDFLQYDRVMVYRFDENWNGEVISEAREPHLESWLGLHYPATDIPQQARKLFLEQGVRMISEVTDDTAYMKPSLSPLTQDIIDLSKSELRAPSSIHIEYLKNMKVGGTLTAAIVYNHTLWGLIACHHYSPKVLGYHKRLSCKFLTQVFSTQLGLRSFNSSLQKINQSSVTRTKLVTQMSANWNIAEGLSAYPLTMLSLTEATGAAILTDGNLTLIGTTPTQEEVLALSEWITGRDTEEELYYTNCLSATYKQGLPYKDVASGVLQVAISKGKNNKLFWFKPEILKTVSWGGNPNKPAEIDENARLSPRISFEKWSEEVNGYSHPWQDYEIAAAKALKESISGIIIEKYDEVMLLNNKLEKAYKELESFSYSVSHDLRAPLRGIDGFAQIIKEDYYETLDDYGKMAVETIISSTGKMNELIDDILNFSGLQQKQMRIGEVSMNDLVKQVLHLNQVSVLYPNTEVAVHPGLPSVTGDHSMILQLLSNLINNALKYSYSKEYPKIEIGFHNAETPVVYYIKDNGIGIDMQYKDAIFGVFNRFVDDSYAGSGIGLAIVKRVVEKHNGNIWVDSVIGEGTTFNFCFNL